MFWIIMHQYIKMTERANSFMVIASVWTFPYINPSLPPLLNASPAPSSPRVIKLDIMQRKLMLTGLHDAL